ncbi:Metallo-peptidase family M12-domain-containing protein [Pyrenochaeta sp. MPI-SDFR-AT-0127]|nr:Metallo-peptidase family M12-domain-containing protein [Pyrenochaeta sp. MPI-SDFR-AT-0127]
MRVLPSLTAALTVALATLAAASSSARAPLRHIALAKNADILTPNHRVTAVSTFDVAFDLAGQRIRLSLEPNHDLFVDGGRISYLNADGSIAKQEPIDRLQHKIYKGIARLKRGNRWDNVGWARISIQRDGLAPLFEGTFTVHHDHHHVKLSSNYKSTRRDEDPDIDLRPEEFMVVFRDSDMAEPEEHSELRRRSAGVGCPSDELHFNTRDDHPVYASMRARDEGFSSNPLSSLFGKRQLDGQPGGNGAGVNLVSTIGSTAGCPSTRKVALVGVAADCTYVQSFNRDKNQTQTNVIQQINSASELFESTFNISLGLANLIVTEPDCPTTQQQATPWNQACSSSISIQDRLNQFSQWRGQQNDQYSHWTLLSTCNTGSAVGLAWLGQACTSGSQGNSGSSSETVAGANVVIKTPTEWQVIAHETGHTYGAVHDCTASQCANSNIVNSQQCCPLSSGTCNAGEGFIMNPSTANGITRFSACSIGNICSALGRNSVKSSCLTNNRDVTTITGQTCGNGIVEGDEQCDCGGSAGCGQNSCCDPDTCRFKNNAVCDDSNEDCCRNCQFASSNTVCRASVGECDPQETCTGSSPYCPEDQNKQDGTDCGNGLSCASGQCTSRDMQCKTVMGSYTQGNDTYACDNSNCMLSCASPEFGRNVCYGLQQNFLDGTPCTGGGSCNNVSLNPTLLLPLDI